MNLYRTTNGLVVRDENAQSWRLAETSWDALIRQDDLRGALERALEHAERVASPPEDTLRAPIGTQEVWAAGVTYYRSRTARMEEARAGGGSDFYDQVTIPSGRSSSSRPRPGAWSDRAVRCGSGVTPAGSCPNRS